MDEYQGKLRMVTQTRSPTQASHVYVLDHDLKLLWKLLDIAPGESFQWARFMGSKLYMITFEQIDPMFVIDVAQNTPKIIGELKMPGFSNYLHPLGAENAGQQYLLWIGYDTDVNQWGGTNRGGVKIDVYKVDYQKNETADSLCGALMSGEAYNNCLKDVDLSRLRVERVDSLTLGSQWSYTPVADNPRLFVMDKNYVLTLPLFLQETKETKKRCSVEYDAQWTLIKEEDCYTYNVDVATFAGLKSFALNPFVSAPMSETYSKDYLLRLKQVYGNDLYGYMLNDMGMRVWYAGDVTYLMTHYFADFILGDDNTLVEFGA